MPNTMPLVTAALACERVLQEQDGVLTIVRVVDRFIATEVEEPGPDTMPAMPTPAFDLTVLVMLKAGDLHGRFDMSLTLRRPSGSTNLVGQWSVVFDEIQRAANVIGRLRLGAREWGLHSMDVGWNGEHLTSIPITLVQGQSPPSTPE